MLDVARRCHAAGRAAGGSLRIVRLDDAPRSARERDSLFACLSADENARARRYARPELGERWALARARLRSALATELGLAPGAIQFAYGARGRPALASPRTSLHFSVAHADGLSLAAIGHGGLGFDLERSDADAEVGVRHTIRHLARPPHGVSPEAARAWWLRAWTLHEAWGKGLGAGLDLRTTLVLDRDATSGSALDDRGHAWNVESFEAAPGYVAALARLTAPTTTSRCRSEWRRSSRACAR